LSQIGGGGRSTISSSSGQVSSAQKKRKVEASGLTPQPQPEALIPSSQSYGAAAFLENH